MAGLDLPGYKRRWHANGLPGRSQPCSPKSIFESTSNKTMLVYLANMFSSSPHLIIRPGMCKIINIDFGILFNPEITAHSPGSGHGSLEGAEE